jgi:hypothetical protein
MANDADFAEVVHDCLATEYRWDASVDQRSHYLAQLMQVAEIPVETVFPLLWLEDDARGANSTSAETIAEVLVVHGGQIAVAELRRYVETGESWADVLEILAENCPPPEWQDLAATALSRAADDGSLGDIAASFREPWLTWGQENIQLADLFADQEEHRRQRPSSTLAHVPVDELWEMLQGTSKIHVAADVLRELGKRDDFRFLDIVEQLPRNQFNALPSLKQALKAAGSKALPYARQWSALTHPLVHYAADVIADFGQEQDSSVLLAYAGQGVTDGAWCYLDGLQPAFARLGITEAVPLLRTIWHANPHSMNRADTLKALLALDNAWALAQLGDAECDCQADVRGTSC